MYQELVYKIEDRDIVKTIELNIYQKQVYGNEIYMSKVYIKSESYVSKVSIRSTPPPPIFWIGIMPP